MTQSSFPFQAVDTTETQFSQWGRHIVSGGRSGVNGVPGDSNLLVSANSSGMQVFVSAGQAMVRGHYYISTASETLTISAANTSPRIDSIVLKLDPAINSIVLQVVAGTPATSPIAPTLTQTDSAIFQFKLADVRVEASTTTIDASKVTDKRSFMLDVWTTAERPTGILGLVGYNSTTQKLELHNGSTWVDVTASLDASSITSGTIGVDRIPNLSADKITSGTLNSARLGTVPISAGGTGATSAAAARTALDVPATAHTHAIADTTGLQAALDGKSATSHTHTASVITDPENIYAARIRAGGSGTGNPTRVYIQSATPTGASAGDLWFW